MPETSRFSTCLAHVLAQEGGYVDHPADPGGATNLGITRKTLARWRQIEPWWDLPKGAVQALTPTEAASIYQALYWTPCQGDRLPAGIDLMVFDHGVNSGPAQAIRTLQGVLGVRRDGLIGPLTLAALDKRVAANGAGPLIEALAAARLGFLKGLKTFAVFGRGWTRRVDAVATAARAMAGNGATLSPPSQKSERWRLPMTFLNGYRTYIVCAAMLVAGAAQLLGVDLPTLEGQGAGQLIMEALAMMFLRRGIKSDIANV